MTTTPTLDGRIIALAQRATRAALNQVLDRHGLDFETSVVLNLVAAGGGTIPADALLAALARGLGGTADDGRRLLDDVTARGLTVQSGDPVVVGFTTAGQSLHATVTADVDDLVAQIYTGLSPDDLATAGRVLTVVTERAEALVG